METHKIYMESCKNAKNDIVEHFPDVSKMVMIGNEAKRSIDDIMLSFQNKGGS